MKAGALQRKQVSVSFVKISFSLPDVIVSPSYALVISPSSIVRNESIILRTWHLTTL